MSHDVHDGRTLEEVRSRVSDLLLGRVELLKVGVEHFFYVVRGALKNNLSVSSVGACVSFTGIVTCPSEYTIAFRLSQVLSHSLPVGIYGLRGQACDG